MKDAAPSGHSARRAPQSAPAGGPRPAGVFVSPSGLPSDRQILRADLGDLNFLVHLQKRFSNALGFIPRQGLEWYLENRRVYLAVENGQPSGYCLGRERLKHTPELRPVTQAAIDFSAQRRKAGLALVRRFEDEARQANQQGLQAMCREGLDANHFWLAAGFEEIGRYDPENTRNRPMICWRKLLAPHRPYWFNEMPTYCGWKAARRRNDKTQLLLFAPQIGTRWK